MGNGKHASDEEFEFDFEYVKNGIIIVVILAIIAGVVFGIYTLIHKLKETKTEPVSVSEGKIEQSEYDILGKIIISKIDIEQPILDSVEDKALEKGVIKLYGDDLNKERKFLYSRAQL